ncbi:MAG: hypothetical protein Q7J74_11000 [Pseudomonas sp.]|nr:hypothetical protein [Pseudomonas sp.]
MFLSLQNLPRAMAVVLSAVLCLLPLGTQADHSWGNYHWARSQNPFTLKLGDNLSSAWDPYLLTTAKDWSTPLVTEPATSDVLNTLIVAGSTRPKLCRASSGKVEVCNANYGFNGWLGIAQIWASGSHISQGVVKMNDSYFNTASYNKPAWRNLVLCQEVGHTLGLDHQDEDFNNTPLGTCMDYSNDPVPNQHPNQHDYEQLALIYSHLDTFTSLAASSASTPAAPALLGVDLNSQREWGQLLRSRNGGRTEVYARDLGRGHKLFTFVIWAW